MHGDDADQGHDADGLRVSKTMAFLLRHRPDVGDLEPDDQGWVALDALASAVSRLLRMDVAPDRVREVVEAAEVQRFEIQDFRIRALGRRRPPPRPAAPDILYHAATAEQVERYAEEGVVSAGRRRSVFLSDDEAHAWRVAHRLGGSPRVLYVDTTRSRRHGLHFARNRRNGLYLAPEIPASDVLNLLPNFAEQLSAGGIPIQRDAEGVPRMALIRVTRRSGRTWEVAKGKLEVGETPEHAAIREVREEMGIDVDLRITGFVSLIRYGFLAPGGLPRLKTVYLYLMEPVEPLDDAFRPATREGIGEVCWFTPEHACRAVTHSSLVPAMRHARRLVRGV